jgi:hypothetical protein
MGRPNDERRGGTWTCGWNVLWNNINKEEQDKFIMQAENLA